MKISLITYHVSSNYGAIMQTYALCEYLKILGHNVELIDIRQSEETKGIIPKLIKPVVFWLRMKTIIKTLYPPFSKRYKDFNHLQKEPPVADIYLVGSDQVWNPNISKNLQMAYFLDFGGSNVKRVSYASSFGITQWPSKDNIAHISECLRRFDSLSVREEEGKIVCEKVFDCVPEVVVDPTFLLDDYKKLVNEIEERDEIICYKLKKDEDFFDNVRIIGKNLNLPVTLLNHNYKVKGLRYCLNPSLKQWLKRIASAKFIITDSFHGIAFSLIFNKQFVVIKKNDGKDSRLINILRKVGLEHRMYDSTEILSKDKNWSTTQIDYSKVNEKIKILREKSRGFLIKALS